MNHVPFGLKDDVVYHISEVERGIDCECKCPECGLPLTAKKGDIREHHFAHATSTSFTAKCQGGLESALHRYAKQIISEALYFVTPSLLIGSIPPEHKFELEIPSQLVKFQRVELEESMAFERRRVDVVGYSTGGRLLIEICVTHRVRGRKLKEVRAAKEAMVEVSLERALLYSKVSRGAGSPRHAILDSVESKRWLFHPNADEIRSRLKEYADRRKPQIPWSGSDGAEDKSFEPPARNTQLQEQAPQPRHRHGHVPDRSKLLPGAYVIEMRHFLSGLKSNEDTKQQMLKALWDSGNITSEDVQLAASLGFDLN